MLSRIKSSAVMGIDAYCVEIEVDAHRGLPSYALVGLPDTAVKESRERIFSAIKNSDYDLPTYRIVANLAPADIKKEGSAFDLPLALGILQASGLMELPGYHGQIILGELSLDGRVKAVKGVLPMAIAARCRRIFTTIRHSPTRSSWAPPTCTMAAVIFLHRGAASSPS